MAKDRRKKILKAAEGLLDHRRFHEVTMDAVAQAAGVGKGTIYRYFDNKEHLFTELANFGFDELYETMHATPAGSESFEQNLAGVCTSISDFFVKRRALMRVMSDAEDREACVRRQHTKDRHENRRQLHAELVRWLEDGVRNEELRDDLPLDQLSLFLLSMLRGRIRHGRYDEKEIPMKNLIALFLDGCKPRRSP